MDKLHNKYYWVIFVAIFAIGSVCGYFLFKLETEKNAMPGTMPKDFAFSIRYGIEGKNEINTFKGTVTKDLVVDGVATTNISFTTEEMQSIYEKMREIDIVEPKRMNPLFNDVQSAPHGQDFWKIRLNGKTIELNYIDHFTDSGVTKDKKELLELRDSIINIVKNKEEYKKLPEARGGYA